MFSFRKKKAKKNINSLVLASVAAGSLAFPNLIKSLSTLRLATQDNVQHDNAHSSIQRPKSRVQSLGGSQFISKGSSATLFESEPSGSIMQLNHSTELMNHESWVGAALNEGVPMARGLRKSPPQYQPKKIVNFSPSTTIPSNIEHEDWDLEFNVISSRAPPLPPFPRAPKPNTRSKMPKERRVFSAPSSAMIDYDQTENMCSKNGVDIVDVLWEGDDNEFVVPSVNQKVKSRAQKELERSISAEAGLESWDDDFCEDFESDASKILAGTRSEHSKLAPLKIPEFVDNVQDALRIDSDNLRNFALHVEDLKLLYLDATDMSQGLECELPDKVQTLTLKYQKSLDLAKVLIALGDYNDQNCNMEQEKLLSHEYSIRILNEVLAENVSEMQDLMTLKLASQQLKFTADHMPVFIKCITHVKQQVHKYVIQLRQISREGC